MSDALFTYWVGMDIPADTSAADVADFNHFYSNTHRPEVLAGNPGFLRGRRYELAQDDPRGPRGPRFLAAYDIESEEAALLYISRNDGPASGRPVYSDGPSAWQKRQTKWRLLWKHLLNNPAASRVSASPYMYLVGMSEALGSTATEIVQFNEFYNRTHVPEVLNWIWVCERCALCINARVYASCARGTKLCRDVRDCRRGPRASIHARKIKS
jgi:hypothetical protein